MGDKAGNDLFYGQFGRATYDPQDKQWTFQRVSPTVDHCLRPLGEPTVVIPPSSVANPGREIDGKEGPARRREKQVKALVQAYPDLHPASDLLPELARVSEAAGDAAERHDQTVGNLLVFGSVYVRTLRKSIEIVAFPSGPTGCDLRVLEVQRQKRGRADSKKAWLEVPAIYGVEATWHGPGAGIKSIHISQPASGKDTVLAVRLITETLTFQPLFEPARASHPGRIDLKLLATIDIGQTGGLPHADIAFSPLNHQRLAVVDQSGSRSVWKISARPTKKDPEALTCETSDGAESSPRKISEDGWVRVHWVGNGDLLAVCTRRKLKLINLTDGLSTEVPDTDLGLSVQEGSGCILDVVAVPSQSNCLCILTSNVILMHRIDSEDETRRLIQVRHFRNAEDISLRLSVFQDKDDDFLLLLRSSISSVIICYRLNIANVELIRIGDPTELNLPFEDQRSTSSSVLDLLLQVLPPKTKRVQPAHAELLSAIEQGARYYSMTMLCKDLSLCQSMYLANNTSNSLRVEPFSWNSDLRSEVQEMSEDEFIVEDNDLGDAERVKLRREPVSRFVKRRTRPSSKDTDLKWTINHERTAQHLEHSTEVIEMNELLAQAQETLRNPQGVEPEPFRTLRELKDGEITVRDIEGTAAQIDNLQLAGGRDGSVGMLLDEVEHPQKSTQRTLERTRIPPSLGMNLLDQPERLQRFYESAKRMWVTALPEDVPDGIVEAKELLAERVASEVALASYVLRPEALTAEQHTQKQSQSQDWDLPVRSGASRVTDAKSQDSFSQRSTLPTPSTSRSASTATGSSHPSTFVAAPEIARLSRYTTFSKPAPPPLPRSLQRVLTHWTPGRDPADYDWLSISRNVSRREDDEEGEEMTEKERKRMQRRTERYVERQRREAEESQRQQALSSSAPTIVTASQPPPVVKGAAAQSTAPAGSSQPFGLSQAAASQVLPGRHGGRPPKKKRKSGF